MNKTTKKCAKSIFTAHYSKSTSFSGQEAENTKTLDEQLLNKNERKNNYFVIKNHYFIVNLHTLEN